MFSMSRTDTAGNSCNGVSCNGLSCNGVSCHDRTQTEKMIMVALPKPVAVVCCVFNFLFPGLGTMLTGCATCCCGRHWDMDPSDVCASCTANIILGFIQLLLTPLFLIGWFWSCLWGVLFLRSSDNYYHDTSVHRTDSFSSNFENQQSVIIIEPIDALRMTRHHYDPDKYDPPPQYDTLIHESDEGDEPLTDDNEPPPPYVPP